MKICPRQSIGSFHLGRAFTLVEVVVASGILSLVILAIVQTHISGMRLFRVQSIKLTAGDDVRQTVDLLLDDIRSASSVNGLIPTLQVGYVTNSVFYSATGAQQGDCLRIYPLNGSSSYIQYTYDTNKYTLTRSTANGASVSSKNVTANLLTNDLPLFKAVKVSGSSETVNAAAGNNSAIRVTLTFTKLKNPEVFLGEGNQYDFLRLSFLAGRRCNE